MIVAMMPLHYGLDYLEAAVRSIYPFVDEVFFLYSAFGSHGTRIDATSPDSRTDLMHAAMRAAGPKLRWYENDNWTAENQQRGAIFELCPEADIILALDSDEIWNDNLTRKALEEAEKGEVRNIRLPMIHFWRSFYRAILHDPAFPERVINTRVQGGERTVRAGEDDVICHMGYAQRSEVVRYKMQIHGHIGQFRQDINWYEQRFMMAHAWNDLHPIGSEYWNAEPVNPFHYMPHWMREHPYARLEIIP